MKLLEVSFKASARTDLKAAKNIRWGAGVNQPIVVCPDGNLNHKPTPLEVGS